MKERLTTGIIWLFLAFVTVTSVTGYIKEQQKSNRLLYDLKAARDSAQTFTTRDGHQASKLIAQNLTPSEFKKVNPETVAKLKNMYIRPGMVQSYTETSAQMKAEVLATVKDSIVANTPANEPGRAQGIAPEPQPEKLKVLKYRDKWISISGVVDLDTAKITVLANDTIFTAIYRGERRHPWAWILSRRQLTAAATNRNPYIKINVIQSGVIKK